MDSREVALALATLEGEHDPPALTSRAFEVSVAVASVERPFAKRSAALGSVWRGAWESWRGGAVAGAGKESPRSRWLENSCTDLCSCQPWRTTLRTPSSVALEQACAGSRAA